MNHSMPGLPVHHQLPEFTKLRLIKFFAAKDGEALYSQQKYNVELTVAQIIRSLLHNSGSNEKSSENHQTIQV